MLIFDGQLKDYDQYSLFQWEITVSFTIKNANAIDKIEEIGRNIKTLLVMLNNTHSDIYEIFNEERVQMIAPTFPKQNEDIASLLKFETKEDQYNNVSMLFHVRSTVLFSQFKRKIFMWL